LIFTLVVSSRRAESAAAEDVLRRATEILNPGTDSSAILDVTEWENGQPYAKSRYQVAFRGQNLMLLRKTAPEKDRGRAILLQRNLMWIELSAARKPLQLSLGQRWTSEAALADLARANFSRDYRIQRLIEEAGDWPTQHFFLQALRDDVPYFAVELWIDKKSGNPIRATFTTTSKALSKTCEYRSYESVLGQLRPVQFTLSDSMRPGWKGELTFRHWVPATLDSSLFEYSALGKEESIVVKPSRARDVGQQKRPAEDMVLVPSGPFEMGRDNGFPDEEPAHEVILGAFWVDRTEVTVRQYRRFLKARHQSFSLSPVSPSMPRNYFVDAAYDNFPMIDVSWRQATEFCQWMAKRLPTEAEWEKTARGVDRRIYPWGNVWDPDLANSRENSVSSLANRMVHFTDEVGSVSQNASPYGALDMAGNVWEWVGDWYAVYPGGHSRSDSYGQKYKVIRGGSWVSSALSLTTVARDFANPHDGYDSIGFRCVRDEK
jgi:formylglycine-generating enzyme required for sulfatase activity